MEGGEVGDEAQFDAGARVALEQVAELDGLEGHDRRPGDEVARRAWIRLERLAGQPVADDACVTQRREPVPADRVDARGAIAAEEPFDILVGRPLDGPEGRARALARARARSRTAVSRTAGGDAVLRLEPRARARPPEPFAGGLRP